MNTHPVWRRRTLLIPTIAICVAFVSGTAASPVEAAGTAAAAPAQRAALNPGLAISGATGTDAAAVPASSGSNGTNALSSEQPDFDPVAVANRYLNDAGRAGANGLDAGGSAFANPEWTNAVSGGYVVRYEQQVQGIPVWGAGAAVRLDDRGGLLSVSQDVPAVAPAQGLTPAVAAANASSAAVAASRATMATDNAENADKTADEQLVAEQPILTVYDASVVGGDPNADRFDGPILVWDVTVANQARSVVYRNLIDAMTGEAVLSFSEVEAALNRLVCDMDNDAVRTQAGNCKTTRTEGQGATPVAAVNTAYEMAGYFYTAISNQFGRDSYDNKGARMVTGVNVCFQDQICPLRNAYWNGSAITIGAGLEFDDVIFHEWTHAITQYSADLLYYAESGAINESMSDVFGEIYDQAYTGPGSYDPPGAEWQIGEGMSVPGLPSPLRNMKNPPSRGHPDAITSSLYHEQSTDNWGVHINSGVNNKAAYLIAAGDTFNGQTISGIGNPKTLALYYEALTGILTPGSDYLDLSNALPQACINLTRIGKLTAADCENVDKAVTATAMRDAAQTRKLAADCPSGTATAQFAADAEHGLYQFATTASGGASRFAVSTIGSQSGTHSYYNKPVANGPNIPSSILQTRYPVYISSQQDAFLRFDHSFDMGTSGAAGVIEYSTDGTTWADLGTTPGTLNGYNGTVLGGQLNQRPVFQKQSQGFEQVRVPLSFLAGKTVQLRWRYVGAGSADTGSDGSWMIDDVRVYTCGDAAPTDTAYESGRFQPVSPARLFDTRPDQPAPLVSVPTRKLNADEVLSVDMTGLRIFRYGDRPTAVAVNVTAVGSGELNHVTVYPCGSETGTSTLNFGPNEATANATIVPITSDQRLCFKALKPVDLLADVTGYFTSTRVSSTSTYRPLAPKRVFDTRNNSGNLTSVPTAKVQSGTIIRVPMKGLPIYTDGDTPVAAAVTVTAAGSTTIGHVTVYPCANGQPVASTLNLKPGRAVPNSAIIPFDANGDICLHTVGNTDLLMDISGYFTSGGAGYKFASVAPVRAVDTRGLAAKFDIKGLRTAGQSTTVPMGTLGVYGSNTPKAAVINMTAAGATAAGHANVYPCSATSPNTSINNYKPGSARASGAIATLDETTQNTCMFNFKPVHLVVDVTGYFY